MENNHLIITISREYGSGGREIGRQLASRLGIAYYDKKLIIQEEKKSGIDENLFDNVEERANDSLIYSLAMGLYASANHTVNIADLTMNDRIYKVQSDVIKQVASEGPCVIVGRCADHILRGLPNCVNLFIHASMENRARRAIEVYKQPEDGILDLLVRMDKRRRSYHNYYSDEKWGDAHSYHISLDSGVIGIEAAVEVILCYLSHRDET